ncbi:MAG: MiaB/RimO family radical SAM methylthiotransferase [Elusimicrobiaceae bacterium]|nr:MiaB/RimO family radical SAM methylthiotransferase [Elusimicrobiaceae bacterium]
MKIYIKTFGCRVNQVESQHLSEKFLAAGCELCGTFECADVCLLNTCTVTGEADRDVERLARRIARRNPSARLILTGCYATMHSRRIREVIPSAEVIGNADKKNISALLLGSCAGDDAGRWTIAGHLGHTRAFVKIQDGCSDGCRYCIVWKARSVMYSKPLADAVAEIRGLVEAGYPEIVLTGINVGNYRCPETGAELDGLLTAVFALEGRFRVRLSSLEPKNITPRFIAACAAGADKFCAHFHLPLQAGTDRVLAAMGRRYDTDFYASRVALLRSAFAEPGIYADLIAGYPAETAPDFEAGKAFVQALQLSGLHVFRFSPRPGTEAAALEGHAPSELKRRADELRALDGMLRKAFAAALAGTSQLVTVEECRPDGSALGVAGNFQKIILKNCSEKNILRAVTVLRAQDGTCFA